MTLGSTLRARRLNLNIPAKCVAEDMGINRANLAHLELKDADMRLSTLRKWAAALNLKIVLVEVGPKYNTSVVQDTKT